MKRIVIALALVCLAGAAHADIHVDVLVGGGTVIDYDASGETGNAFGFTALVGYGDFAGGVGFATVLPDSRTQGQFNAIWAEGRWYMLGRDVLLQPYAVLGLGGSTGDDFVFGTFFEDNTPVMPPRWSSSGGFLGMLGAGARYGNATGAFLGVDVRAWNLGHLGFTVSAGYTF